MYGGKMNEEIKIGGNNKKILFYLDSLIMGGAEKVGVDYLNLLNEIDKYDIFLVINENNGKLGNILIDRLPKNVEYQFIIKEKTMERLNYYKEKRKKNSLYKIMYTFYRKKKRFERRNIEKVLQKEFYDVLIDFQGRIPFKLLDERVIVWQHLPSGEIKDKNGLRKYLNKLGKKL